MGFEGQEDNNRHKGEKWTITPNDQLAPCNIHHVHTIHRPVCKYQYGMQLFRIACM